MSVDGPELIREALENIQSSHNDFFSSNENIRLIDNWGKQLSQVFLPGNKVLSCGNGGSMCDAMHFAEEFTGRFREERESLPAIAISDPSYLTCTGNDYGFEYVFSRFVEGVGVQGDLLLGISTSGNSENVYNAVLAAKKRGIFTVGLLGKNGGSIKELVDLPIIVPAQTSDRVQENHIKIIHIAIQLAEQYYFSLKNK